jgi:hypothetical protein
MAKYLFPVAAVLAWGAALAALSGFDSTDAERDGNVVAQEDAVAARGMSDETDADKGGSLRQAEFYADRTALTKQ